MNQCRIILINLLNRHHRFDSDARRLTLKDTDHYYILAWLDFFIIGSNDETCLVIQEKSKNSGL